MKKEMNYFPKKNTFIKILAKNGKIHYLFIDFCLNMLYNNINRGNEFTETKTMLQ